MSGKNKVHPDHYKVAGRLSQDDLARERRRQSEPLFGETRGRQDKPLPPWMLNEQEGRPAEDDAEEPADGAEAPNTEREARPPAARQRAAKPAVKPQSKPQPKPLANAAQAEAKTKDKTKTQAKARTKARPKPQAVKRVAQTAKRAPTARKAAKSRKAPTSAAGKSPRATARKSPRSVAKRPARSAKKGAKK